MCTLLALSILSLSVIIEHVVLGQNPDTGKDDC